MGKPSNSQIIQLLDQELARRVQSGVPEIRAKYDMWLEMKKHQSPELEMKVANREGIAKLGQHFWPHTFAKTKDDKEAMDSLIDLAEKDLDIKMILQVPSQQIAILYSALWCDQAFPQITMGHKYAASLLATSPSGCLEDMVRAPWQCFWIVVPKGLIFMSDLNNQKVIPITGILIAHRSNGWCYITISEESDGSLWETKIPTLDLVTKEDPPKNVDQTDKSYCEWLSAFNSKKSSIDERAAFLIRRLIVNVCLAMSNPVNLRLLTKTRENMGVNKRQSNEPVIRTYELGHKITLDCREQVIQFAKGEAKTNPTVQVLVAGHWKRQAHGVKRLDRKLIHIEPYWRGPEDGPILLRDHELKKGCR